jgi:Kdo2-lipid IVA lauroyltransferase/acyltransferase
MLVGGHFANWELMAAMAVRQGIALTVVHDPRADRSIETMLRSRREALGCRFLPSDASVHALVAELRAGRSLGLLVDQRHDDGEGIALFGRPAPAPLAPAMLGARLGLPFVPIRIERVGGCRFRITVEPPIEPDPAMADRRLVARDMTSRLYARFEQWIREHPEQWLCIKRRWPAPRRRKWRERSLRNPRLFSAPGRVATQDGLADRRAEG